jgi:hypothetical protein
MSCGSNHHRKSKPSLSLVITSVLLRMYVTRLSPCLRVLVKEFVELQKVCSIFDHAEYFRDGNWLGEAVPVRDCIQVTSSWNQWASQSCPRIWGDDGFNLVHWQYSECDNDCENGIKKNVILTQNSAMKLFYTVDFVPTLFRHQTLISVVKETEYWFYSARKHLVHYHLTWISPDFHLDLGRLDCCNFLRTYTLSLRDAKTSRWKPATFVNVRFRRYFYRTW